MDRTYLLTLLEKYDAGQCTPEELAELEGWYAGLGEALPDEILVPGSEAARQHTSLQLAALRLRLRAADGQRAGRSSFRRVWRWAAVFIGLVLVAGIMYYLLTLPAARHDTMAVQIAQPDYSRYIKLPDGSTVVLRAGSRLEYPNTFGGDMREVRLSGGGLF